MKQLVKLTPINKKGFNFVDKNGLYHSCKIKKDRVILRDKNGNKKVVTKKDKRFTYEDLTLKANIVNRTPLSSYADYFE
jgi:hypothetical protein